MKYVHHISDIADLWFNQSQDSARSPGGTSWHDGGKVYTRLFFEGDTIYSYGRHFPIAKHVTNSKGQKAILFNEEQKRSVNTDKHRWMVEKSFSRWDNVNHVWVKCDRPVFEVPATGGDYNPRLDNHVENLRWMLTQMDQAWAGAFKVIKRKRFIGLESMLEWQAKARAYAKFFGITKATFDLSVWPDGCAGLEEVTRLIDHSKLLQRAHEAGGIDKLADKAGIWAALPEFGGRSMDTQSDIIVPSEEVYYAY